MADSCVCLLVGYVTLAGTCVLCVLYVLYVYRKAGIHSEAFSYIVPREHLASNTRSEAPVCLEAASEAARRCS